jgi:hypothetical protein
VWLGGFLRVFEFIADYSKLRYWVKLDRECKASKMYLLDRFLMYNLSEALLLQFDDKIAYMCDFTRE